MVIGNAFCAPTLPSSHVNDEILRYAGFGLRCWKSLTSRMSNPFFAADDGVAKFEPNIVTYAVFPSFENSRSCHWGYGMSDVAVKNWFVPQPCVPAPQGISFGFAASAVSIASMLMSVLSGVM